MNSMRGKSAMLMTKGIMDLRSDPPRLVCTVLTLEHPESRKQVTLYPVPNIASPAYFKRVLNADVLCAGYDKILCEDGRLPFQSGTAEGNKQLRMRQAFPFFSLRPVVADGEKFDGALVRDALESRMAYQMVLDGYDPPVDPRARRGVERILDHYADNTKVAVPWGVYHIPYFRYRLQKEGFNVISTEEVVVFGMQQIMAVVIATTVLSMVFALGVTSLIFSFFF